MFDSFSSGAVPKVITFVDLLKEYKQLEQETNDYNKILIDLRKTEYWDDDIKKDNRQSVQRIAGLHKKAVDRMNEILSYRMEEDTYGAKG